MKRGVVIKLYGDRQIAGAISDGMARALPQEQVEIVEAEIDRQNIQRSLLRVAVNNTKTPDDYNCMTAKAQWDYRWIYKEHGHVYNFFLIAWAVIWYIIFECFDYFSQWNRA